MFPGRKPVIAALGATAFSKDSGRSETLLAIESVGACLADAGLEPGAVDGLVTFTQDRTSEVELQRGVGLGDVRFMARIPYGGGGGCGVLRLAAMAVAGGYADNVVVWRALNCRSGERFGSGRLSPLSEIGNQNWYTRFGLMTPAARVGITATQYLQRYGLEPQALAEVVLNARRHAVTNPAAHFYGKPFTLEDYEASPWVSWPLRRADCCQESDGSVAFLVTTEERARDLRSRSVHIRAAAQSSGADQGLLGQYWSKDILKLSEAEGLKRQLEGQAGMRVADVDAAMIYDHFSPLVLLQLEQLGFCDDGEGSAFLASRRLPVNTHGGHMGEAYIHGMNAILEGARQLRGEAANQLSDVRRVLVTSCAAGPSSALILSSD